MPFDLTALKTRHMPRFYGIQCLRQKFSHRSLLSIAEKNKSLNRISFMQLDNRNIEVSSYFFSLLIIFIVMR